VSKLRLKAGLPACWPPLLGLWSFWWSSGKASGDVVFYLAI